MPKQFNTQTTLWLIDQAQMTYGICTPELVRRKFPDIPGRGLATKINSTCDEKQGYAKKIELTEKDLMKYGLTSNRAKFRYELTKKGKDYLAARRSTVLTIEQIKEIPLAPSNRPLSERPAPMPTNPHANAMINSISETLTDFGITLDCLANINRLANEHLSRRNKNLGEDEDESGPLHESDLDENGTRQAQSVGQQQS